MNTLERSTERVVTDLKRIARDSEDLLHEAKDAVTEKTNLARKRLGAAVEQARSVCEELEEKTMACAKATDKIVRRHPYETLGLSLLIGFVAGLLIGRR